MLRWTEDSDCYRLRLGRIGAAYACFQLGVAALVTAIVLFIVPFKSVSGVEFPLVWSLGLVGLLLLFRAGSRWRSENWIEVPLTGRCVRWGRGGGKLVSLLDVSSFETKRRLGGVRLLAVLPDGRKLPMLGEWRFARGSTLAQAARMLTELLDARRPEPAQDAAEGCTTAPPVAPGPATSAQTPGESPPSPGEHRSN